VEEVGENPTVVPLGWSGRREENYFG